MSTSKWVQGDAEGAFTQLSLETGGNVERESFLGEFSCSQSLGALDTWPELLMLVDVQRDAAGNKHGRRTFSRADSRV